MILLFGSTGYIGSEFKKQLRQLNLPYICWENTSTTTFADLEKWYEDAGYPVIDAVINAAGYTGKPNVDSCEIYKEETIHGNVIWPQILTDWCALNDIVLGHVSSGCIYQGKKPDGTGFTELDEPNFGFKNNSSFYSGTKVLGENVVKKWNKHYIWRLRIPFEEIDNPRNYISKMLKYEKLLQAENSISHKQEFVSACIQSITKNIPYGIYNVTNTGYLSTDKLVEKLKQTLAPHKKFVLINEADLYSSYAKTPRSNCILDNSKIINAGISMRTVDDAIDDCLSHWISTK